MSSQGRVALGGKEFHRPASSATKARPQDGVIGDAFTTRYLPTLFLHTSHANAWYKLMRGDSVIPRGPTSLVLVRHADEWRILKDQSS